MKISVCKKCGDSVVNLEDAIWIEWRSDDDCGCERDDDE